MNSTLLSTSCSAIVVGLCEATKRAGLPKRYIPILAVALGAGFMIAYGLLTSVGGPDLFWLVVQGVLCGLASVGLYSGVKNISAKSNE